MCAPAGTFHNKVRVCVPASCKQATCMGPGAVWCAAVQNPCCPATLGLHCAKGCLTSKDCSGGYCGLDVDQVYVCLPGSATCML